MAAVRNSDPVIEDVTGQREKHKELNGTVCIYSPYLNRIKTIQEGRRIPVQNAVEDPTAWEILEVCKRIFPEGCVEGENKGYSRDYEAQWPPMRGRIRVRLFNADGKPTNPDITTRKQLFLKVAELIPRMPSRQAGYVDPQQTRSCSFHPVAGSGEPGSRGEAAVPVADNTGGCAAATQRGSRLQRELRSDASKWLFFRAAAMGAAEAKIAGAVKKNTGGSNKKKKGQKR